MARLAPAGVLTREAACGVRAERRRHRVAGAVPAQRHRDRRGRHRGASVRLASAVERVVHLGAQASAIDSHDAAVLTLGTAHRQTMTAVLAGFGLNIGTLVMALECTDGSCSWAAQVPDYFAFLFQYNPAVMMAVCAVYVRPHPRTHALLPGLQLMTAAGALLM